MKKPINDKPPFVTLALTFCEKMEIIDKKGTMLAMRFSKLYGGEKMGKILEQSQKFYWWRNNPTAAFMKAVGIVNKQEKNER